ncbi:MAG TPA: hypothetical protein VMB50_22030 [Myxococcales bacterium]|nr:hypothetical protein [Myxococcales bacterium]
MSSKLTPPFRSPSAATGHGLRRRVLPELLREMLVVACLLAASRALAGGGPCPAGVPVTGSNCYFIAANGSDSNTGTCETPTGSCTGPWQHAPGMPACTASCAAVQTAGVGGANMGGLGFIFRGGDTWHEGNGSASPYTGGSFDIYDWFTYAYNNPFTSCSYEGDQSGCLYVGVDKSWYAGATWARPILTGDNPATGLTLDFAPSCAYTVPNPGPGNTGGSFGHNDLVVMASFTILDDLELTGLCANDTTPSGDTYVAAGSSGCNYPAEHFLENVYLHGWSATSNAGGGSTHPLTLLTGGECSGSVYDHIVIDGSDSNPEVAAWGTFPTFEHMQYSMVRYTGQGVGAACHDVHDNVLEHMYNTLYDGHTNVFECNSGEDLAGAPNVFYDNVFRHNDPSLYNAVGWWFPRSSGTTPTVYVFNNLIYDAYGTGIGEAWDVSCGQGGTECPGPFPPIYFFNNTSLDTSPFPCYMSTYPNEASTAYVYNNQLINTGWDGTGPVTCNGGPGSPSNLSMTDAEATAAAYTTGVGGTAQNGNDCANDATTPCGPTSPGSPTVGAGVNLASYCATLASFTSEEAIGVDAATACLHGTTDACAYDDVNHVMNCPAQLPVPRPMEDAGAWDVGIYQCSLADGGCTLSGTSGTSSGGASTAGGASTGSATGSTTGAASSGSGSGGGATSASSGGATGGSGTSGSATSAGGSGSAGGATGSSSSGRGTASSSTGGTASGASVTASGGCSCGSSGDALPLTILTLLAWLTRRRRAGARAPGRC